MDFFTLIFIAKKHINWIFFTRIFIAKKIILIIKSKSLEFLKTKKLFLFPLGRWPKSTLPHASPAPACWSAPPLPPLLGGWAESRGPTQRAVRFVSTWGCRQVGPHVWVIPNIWLGEVGWHQPCRRLSRASRTHAARPEGRETLPDPVRAAATHFLTPN